VPGDGGCEDVPGEAGGVVPGAGGVTVPGVASVGLVDPGAVVPGLNVGLAVAGGVAGTGPVDGLTTVPVVVPGLTTVPGVVVAVPGVGAVMVVPAAGCVAPVGAAVPLVVPVALGTTTGATTAPPLGTVSADAPWALVSVAVPPPPPAGAAVSVIAGAVAAVSLAVVPLTRCTSGAVPGAVPAVGGLSDCIGVVVALVSDFSSLQPVAARAKPATANTSAFHRVMGPLSFASQ
jgi:hypothetical protein